MNSTIILKDGIEVEVEIDNNHTSEISSGSLVDSSLENIEPLLRSVITPINNIYNNINDAVSIESAKVSVGIKINVEGGFILAKSSAEAHITVEMNIRPKNA
jgi:hypothetical protein